MTNPTVNEESPDQRVVQAFHRNDDLNSRPEAHHHSLGTGRNNASEGSHTHDGTTSVAPLTGVVFTGSRVNNTADLINQICNALALFGATNSTS